jgi:hypothetical protein
MKKLGWQPAKWLEKKAKKGARDYPIGTVAFYGPDDRRATKVAVGIVEGPQTGVGELRRWFDEERDLRSNKTVLAEIAMFLREREVLSVAVIDRIIGCPHEEGIDYPMGEVCPKCPYWAKRDRWTGARTAD